MYRIIITIELVTILLLTSYIVWSKNRMHYDTYVIRDYVALSASDTYDYFYEPLPGEYIESRPLGSAKSTTNIQINGDSLHDRIDYEHEKDARVYRIVTLGDSWTFGLYVDTKDNYTELLEEKLNDEFACANYDAYEVINLGVAGYDVAYSVERFDIRGVSYDPDAVLFLLTGNDFTRVREFMLSEGLQTEGERSVEVLESMSVAYSEQELLDFQMEKLQSLQTMYDNPLVLYTSPLNTSYTQASMQALELLSAESTSTTFYRSNIALGESGMFQYHPNEVGHQVMADEIYELLTRTIISCE